MDSTLITGIPMTQENDFSRKDAILDLRNNNQVKGYANEVIEMTKLT
jgi:hypothetical protein